MSLAGLGFDAGVTAGYRLEPAELTEVTRHDAAHLPIAAEADALWRQLATTSVTLLGDFSRDSAPTEDPSDWLRGHLPRLRIAFVGGEASQLEPLVALSRTTEALIVLTAGADGAWAIAGGASLHQPKTARLVVDTTGCGDAFQGAFSAAFLSGAGLAGALAAGAELAARVAARRGAWLG